MAWMRANTTAQCALASAISASDHLLGGFSAAFAVSASGFAAPVSGKAGPAFPFGVGAAVSDGAAGDLAAFAVAALCDFTRALAYEDTSGCAAMAATTSKTVRRNGVTLEPPRGRT